MGRFYWDEKIDISRFIIHQMKTIVLLSNHQNLTVTFYRPTDKDCYVGYRFLEGKPGISENINQDYHLQPVSSVRDITPIETETIHYDKNKLFQKGWLESYDGMEAALQAQLKFNTNPDGSANAAVKQLNIHLDLEFYFQPDRDGIQIALKVHSRRDIVGSCLLQQCLRFTGSINQHWRTEIAHVPFLSEFDMQAMGRPNASLTYYRQNNNWLSFPVQHTTIQTIEPGQNCQDKEIADHGLIVRESAHRDQAPGWYWDQVAPGTKWDQISAGLYWERTAKISNRHPADCVHAWVDIGPLSVEETRVIRGKIYYLEGSKEDLFGSWLRDFSSTA
jgi:hypothetical protein